MQEDQKKSYFLPVSILLAGVLISGSVIYSVGNSATNQVAEVDNQPQQEAPGDLDAIRPVTKEDHRIGPVNAPVKIIEFSDLDCPFCQRIHPTLKKITEDYGNKVVWVYRHFPLDQLHPNANKKAQATECASEVGGSDKFWSYIDKLFVADVSGDLDDKLAQIAADLGINRSKFTACLKSGKYAKHIEADIQDATNTGGTGTPWNIVIAPNGKKIPVSGAQPYAAFKQVIDLALKEK